MRNWIILTIITGIILFVVVTKVANKVQSLADSKIAMINELLEN